MIWRFRRWTLTSGLYLFVLLINADAQPKPGDVFREYAWTTPPDGELFLRVGGKLDYQGTPEKFAPGHLDENGYLLLPAVLDLNKVTRAELTFEKLLSHEDTRDLKISWNGSEFLPIPESQHIPAPQSEYYYHFYPTIDLPLQHLQRKDNRFKLTVDSVQDWNWPQNLLYGVILRLYYDQDPRHLHGELSINGSVISDTTQFEFKAQDPARVNKVHFMGNFEGINYEGDGRYRQWHYHYHRGQLMHHIGTADVEFTIEWITTWIPDQELPIEISAWVQDDTGLTWFLPPLQDLKLKRNYSVELCKPYDVPERWVTRGGEHEQHFKITGNLKKASAAKIIWTSWSPGYMNGLYINDFLVYIGNEHHYVYMPMEISLEQLHMLQPGENTIKTGKTPLYQGQMVHGMEVMWPGMMVLIQYKN